MTTENVKTAAKELPNDFKNPIGIIKILLVITVTVLAIYIFKIPVWGSVKRGYRRARNYTRRRRSYRKRK